MAEENYYADRDKENNLKIRKLLAEELPRLCNEYFLGVQTHTTPLTRLGYAQDLCVFFDFLFKQIDDFAFCDKDHFTYADLDRVNATHIEIFMDYLSFYTYGGREFSNSLKTKSRKLSTLKSFFKYYYNKDRITANPAAKVATPKIKDKPILRLDNEEVGSGTKQGALSDFLPVTIERISYALGFDTEFVAALPTAIMKPLSGSGARAMMIETLQTYGADSFQGFVASVVQGSTETTFYVLAVYFGAVNISKVGAALPCALLSDLAGIVAAIALSYVFY